MIPPTVTNGHPATDTYELGPGIKGYAVEDEGLIYIPLVSADNPGQGDMGRFIDSLDSNCVFSAVFSQKLQGMLVRRMWVLKWEFVVEAGEEVPFWYHPDRISSLILMV